jgi:hypothetical protein
LLEIFTGDFPGIGQIAGEFHSDRGHAARRGC